MAMVRILIVRGPLLPRHGRRAIPEADNRNDWVGSQFEICPNHLSRLKGKAKAPMLSAKMGTVMAFTVIWYGREGVIDQVTFDAEKTAKDHAIAMFQTRRGDDGVVCVEVRKDNGAVVFSHAEN
ncbi:hypothetical protein [Mesorhizobium sp. B2-3-5]|uniref:hypothetical protein n=2 Tax=unclassified Mesorhizobium TaxID=325217 RepID=UPI0011289B4E|nr:hypothetical protein [Mesorhizobium sp. B2-3-5]